MNYKDNKKKMDNEKSNFHSDEEKKLEKLLAKGTNELDTFQPPGVLWQRIERDLINEKKKFYRLPYPPRWLKRLFPSGSPFFRPVVITAVLVIISLAAMYAGRNFTVTGKLQMQEEAVSEISRAEKHYLNAINKLTQLAKTNEKNVDNELLSLYNEKLLYINTSIKECKNILVENNLNSNAWNSLFTFYQKKVETLQEIADYGQNISQEGDL